MSPPPTASPLQRLASVLLGEDVGPWIRRRRPELAWRKIATELSDATNGEIDVPAQTITNWAAFEAPIEQPAARAS